MWIQISEEAKFLSHLVKKTNIKKINRSTYFKTTKMQRTRHIYKNELIKMLILLFVQKCDFFFCCSSPKDLRDGHCLILLGSLFQFMLSWTDSTFWANVVCLNCSSQIPLVVKRGGGGRSSEMFLPLYSSSSCIRPGQENKELVWRTRAVCRLDSRAPHHLH